jgi:hypothetical protein
LALAGVLAAAGLSSCQWDETRFFDLRVVNDTHQAVKIQPCWDVDCLNVYGMPVTVLRPGDSRHESSWWADDAGQKVAVAVLHPGGRRIMGCLITSFAPGQPTGLVRASQQRQCLHAPEGGPGG